MAEHGEFDFYIGVDQTGAAAAKGMRARPLACAILYRDDSAKAPSGAEGWVWKTRTGWIPSFDFASLEAFLRSAIPEAKLDSSCAILVDCVFGLAPEARKDSRSGSGPLWRLFREARGSTGDGPHFGRSVAEAFFRTLWCRQGVEELPRRRCEMLAKANSVFVTRPFQKNIQTGTFRIWRDLASENEWASIWPFDTRKDRRPWIFEGFPTLFWKRLLGIPTRDGSRLDAAVRRELGGIQLGSADRDRLKRSADLRDAWVLACGGAILDGQGRLMEPFQGFKTSRGIRTEGWIAGLNP